jgi:hypothetical protein
MKNESRNYGIVAQYEPCGFPRFKSLEMNILVRQLLPALIEHASHSQVARLASAKGRKVSFGRPGAQHGPRTQGKLDA